MLNNRNWDVMSGEDIDSAYNTCVRQVRKNLPEFTDKFPGAASVDNRYRQTENDDWTNGFWTGELWLSYEKTRDEAFKEAAIRQVYDYKRRIIERVVVDHHDMGFLYSPSCVAAWRILKDSERSEDRAAAETAKEAALMAADNLLTRFQEKGQFFQAWGQLGDPKEYRLIIDCLLNMPLLFWASEVTGKEVYRDKAECHIKTAMNYAVRPDNSTYHTYYFEPETGIALEGATRQGNRNGSIWARGQAWGIYGSALSYGYFKEQKYLELFEGITECFINHLPSDLVPYWDFDFTDGSDEPRDSSAAAAAACGLLQMAEYVTEEKAVLYRNIASGLMNALYHHCLVKEDGSNCSSSPSSVVDGVNGILLHGTYAKHSSENGVKNNGVDECCLWGDYFFMEALTRLKGSWVRYW